MNNEDFPNFGGLPGQYSSQAQAAIVVIPVPYDGTSTWVKGAARGPAAILAASANMELYDIATDSPLYKLGIYTAPPVETNDTPENMVQAVYETSLSHLKQSKFPVLIGGEHSVSIGAIKASFESFDKLTVLQLDAHADMRDEYQGSKFNHACVMARVKEMGPFVQVGVRSMSRRETAMIDPSRIYYADDIMNSSIWMDRVVEQLTDNVYITIDLDAFDPSIMPSTATPEPGGLAWYPVVRLLEKVARHKRVIGFDVVELCPNSHNKAPDFLAAKLVYQILSNIFCQQ